MVYKWRTRKSVYSYLLFLSTLWKTLPLEYTTVHAAKTTTTLLKIRCFMLFILSISNLTQNNVFSTLQTLILYHLQSNPEQFFFNSSTSRTVSFPISNLPTPIPTSDSKIASDRVIKKRSLMVQVH